MIIYRGILYFIYADLLFFFWVFLGCSLCVSFRVFLGCSLCVFFRVFLGCSLCVSFRIWIVCLFTGVYDRAMMSLNVLLIEGYDVPEILYCLLIWFCNGVYCLFMMICNSLHCFFFTINIFNGLYCLFTVIIMVCIVFSRLIF